MKVSQQLNHINDHNYDDDIFITGIPKGYFPAVTDISISTGSKTRKISVELLPLEQAEGGAMNVNSGLFIRKSDEEEVSITVSQDGKALASNTMRYS
jgi:hypothetical protein